MPESWSRIEAEAVVADYVAMLIKELSHQAYNKSEHRRNLSKLLARRSDLSIERKHQNISAVMIKCGYPYVFGYKPLGNYQALLEQVVVERLQADVKLSAIAKHAVDEPVELPPLSNILDRLVDPPQVSLLTVQHSENA